MKRMLAFLCLFIPTCVFSVSINVYMRINDPALTQAVSEFNDELQRRGIFDRYGFEPFLNHHLMHATLYLAEYSTTKIDEVVEAARQLACHSVPVPIEITGMSLTSGNYVMLDINNKATPQNPPLQQLSDKATVMLSNLRDYNAPIPDWARNIPVKRKAFEHYGSPNVFFEFNPHLSLMAPLLKEEDARAFQEEVQAVLDMWNFPKLRVESSVLGVGYTNEQGQVTEQIAAFDMASCQ